MNEQILYSFSMHKCLKSHNHACTVVVQYIILQINMYKLEGYMLNSFIDMNMLSKKMESSCSAPSAFPKACSFSPETPVQARTIATDFHWPLSDFSLLSLLFPCFPSLFLHSSPLSSPLSFCNCCENHLTWSILSLPRFKTGCSPGNKANFQPSDIFKIVCDQTQICLCSSLSVLFRSECELPCTASVLEHSVPNWPGCSRRLSSLLDGSLAGHPGVVGAGLEDSRLSSFQTHYFTIPRDVIKQPQRPAASSFSVTLDCIPES